MMPQPDIRPERTKDIPAVRELNQRAFGLSDEGRLVDLVRRRGRGTTVGRSLTNSIYFRPNLRANGWPPRGHPGTTPRAASCGSTTSLPSSMVNGKTGGWGTTSGARVGHRRTQGRAVGPLFSDEPR